MILGPILLLLAEKRGDGSDILERVQHLLPLRAGSETSLYRDLRTLAGAGLVVAVCEPPLKQGPGRRVYELTATGRTALDQWMQAAEEVLPALDALLVNQSDH